MLSSNIMAYKCNVQPNITKIPGTLDQTFQIGQKNIQCNNTYYNVSKGSNMGYCDIHYEEYQETFYAPKK
jgi:hypothetical protein